ncbi:PIN domain-containing protein [Krasilnikovia sp. MM14-A1004]|uniref:PIN domain-containing protein n=1 Tax=Krasilnikovia sp. MM14-A1004 TaxID=3373541 RepID=UPI00399D2F39
MKYLADTSALVRLLRRQVDPAWHRLEDQVRLAVCEPTIAETLLIADSKRYAETERSITDLYLAVPIPDDVWALTATIRRELAQHSAHQGLSVADLVVAATAIRMRLTLLHEDRDFETVERYVPALQQHRISVRPE